MTFVTWHSENARQSRRAAVESEVSRDVPPRAAGRDALVEEVREIAAELIRYDVRHTTDLCDGARARATSLVNQDVRDFGRRLGEVLRRFGG